MKIIDQLPALTTVAPGSKATLQVPTGPTYEGIIFTVTAAAGLDATDIGRIDVLINGTPYQTFKDLQRLIDLNGYYARDADTVTATQIQFKLHLNRRELMDNEFQSSPAPGGGRYLGTAKLLCAPKWFQSSPAPGGGRYPASPHVLPVASLFQSSPAPGGGRYLPVPGLRSRERSFNPRPPRGAGATQAQLKS